MEDVITIIDGRSEIIEEVKQSSPELKKVIGEWFQRLLSDDRFIDSIDGHLPDEAANHGTHYPLKKSSRNSEWATAG